MMLPDHDSLPDTTRPPDPSRPRRSGLTRRHLISGAVGLGGALGLVAVTGCTVNTAAAGTSAATGNTVLGPGTYTATFGSTSSGGGTGGGNAAGGQPSVGASGAPSGQPSGGTPPSGQPSSGAGGTPPSGQPSGQAGGAGGTPPSGSAAGGSAPGGSGTSNTQLLSGAYLVNGIAATIDGGTWASATADQNVFLVVNGGSLTIKNATITKTGDSSNEDACNFYGLNSAILVVGEGSSAKLSNCKVTTNAEGANGVFAASSAAITIDTITITTSKNSSRGLDATYTGTVTASDVTITTAGAHCACLATDRGNGTIAVTGTSKLASAGDGSPLVYSTGDISVTGASGKATGAQTMVIEGKNKITLDGCTFATTGTEGMMIYQSYSGDAADSDATAEKSSMVIKNSTITASTAKPMIYVTNTGCTVLVTKSILKHKASVPLLSLATDRWGTAGSNGGHAAVTFSGCTVGGALKAGKNSSATVALKNASHLTGAKSGSITVSRDSSSTWKS